MRERDRQLRELRPQEVAQLELVHGIDVRVDEADRDRLDVLVANAREQRLETRRIERRLDRTVPAQPLDDLDDVAARHEPLGLAVAQGVELLAIVAGDRVRVAQTLGHDEEQASALALQKRVQADGRAVNEKLDPAQLGNELAQAGEHALRRVRRSREHLPGARLSVLAFVEHDEVRERAADVHRHAISAQAVSSRS